MHDFHSTANKQQQQKSASVNFGGQGGHSFFKPVVQPKLTINQPNDVYEQEADAVADKVMRMTTNENTFFKPSVPILQRKCAHCEEEKKMQRKETNQQKPNADDEFENYVGSLSTNGKSLPKETRNFFESQLSHDFSNVQVHTDSVASKSAQSINALAYTSGNNIVFDSGQFSPNTENGKRLLAHELTHVVQQSGAEKNKIQKQDGPSTTLPPVPHYQLQSPSLLQPPSSSRFQLQSNLFPSPFVQRPGSSLFPGGLPLFQYIPPINLTLTPQQVQRILGEPPPNYLQPTPPPAPTREQSGVRLGGDLSRDVITGNYQVAAVARGLDAGHLNLFNRVVDVLHEPSVTFSAATPGTGIDNSTQFGINVLNIHLSDSLEFAPVQVGVDTGAGVSLGSQLEIHTPNPGYSYFVNFGFNLQRNDDDNYQFSSTGISFSFYPHFLNP